MVEYRGVERIYPKLVVYLKLLSSEKKLNLYIQLFDIFPMSKLDKKDFQSDIMAIKNTRNSYSALRHLPDVEAR